MISKDKLELLPGIELPTIETKRPNSHGAEKWLGMPIKCLDHGFVYLKDYMGNDLSIEEAARVSYGQGTRKISQAEGLIRYLRRHMHTTPFEMVELKFHARMPIFVARQWVRHRTASINEYSARYSIIKEEFHLVEPEFLAEQSKGNRQGRDEVVDEDYAQLARQKLSDMAEAQYDLYEWLLNDDGTGKPVDPDRPMIAREISREPLGLNFYTEWYWKANLHNCLHFLWLRMDEHAQREIRVYADAMAEIISDGYPIAWKAFEDYELNATKFSGPEMEAFGDLLKAKNVRFSLEEIIQAAKQSGISNKREQEEMIEKIKGLGLLL